MIPEKDQNVTKLVVKMHLNFVKNVIGMVLAQYATKINIGTSAISLVMIIVQYLVACALVGLMLWIVSIAVSPITPRGWFEFYRSFTIPYIFLAGFYYYRVFSETKKQDKLIREIQEKKK